MGVRILWLSAPMWAATGYGSQTALTVPKLAALPEVDAIAVAAVSELKAGAMGFQGVYHVASPLDPEPMQKRMVADHMEKMGMDVCISLIDVWTLIMSLGDFRWIPWVPVDGEPLAVTNRFMLDKAQTRLAMSQFGERVMREAGYESTFIPLTIDVNTYRPMAADKRELKKQLGFPPDCFLIGMVAANRNRLPIHRKGYAEAFKTMAAFVKKHPEARLYLHCLPSEDPSQANLINMATSHGIGWEYMKTVDPYFYRIGLPPDAMAHIYNAMDVYFSPSAGEGFNIPLIEAQACGVPVVANACTSQPENVGSGWLVEPAAAVTNTLSSQWFIADALGSDCPECGHHKRGLVDALEDAFQELHDTEKAKKLQHKARKFAQQFDTATVVSKYWKPFLQEVAASPGQPSGAPAKLWTPPVPGGKDRPIRLVK